MITATIVHQNCSECKKEFVGQYPQNEDQAKCLECRQEGQFVIVRHLDPLPDLPPHLDYELVWCNEEEAEFVVVVSE